MGCTFLLISMHFGFTYYGKLLVLLMPGRQRFLGNEVWFRRVAISLGHLGKSYLKLPFRSTICCKAMSAHEFIKRVLQRCVNRWYLLTSASKDSRTALQWLNFDHHIWFLPSLTPVGWMYMPVNKAYFTTDYCDWNATPIHNFLNAKMTLSNQIPQQPHGK